MCRASWVLLGSHRLAWRGGLGWSLCINNQGFRIQEGYKGVENSSLPFFWLKILATISGSELSSLGGVVVGLGWGRGPTKGEGCKLSWALSQAPSIILLSGEDSQWLCLPKQEEEQLLSLEEGWEAMHISAGKAPWNAIEIKIPFVVLPIGTIHSKYFLFMRTATYLKMCFIVMFLACRWRALLVIFLRVIWQMRKGKCCVTIAAKAQSKLKTRQAMLFFVSIFCSSELRSCCNYSK